MFASPLRNGFPSQVDDSRDVNTAPASEARALSLDPDDVTNIPFRIALVSNGREYVRMNRVNAERDDETNATNISSRELAHALLCNGVSRAALQTGAAIGGGIVGGIAAGPFLGAPLGTAVFGAAMSSVLQADCDGSVDPMKTLLATATSLVTLMVGPEVTFVLEGQLAGRLASPLVSGAISAGIGSAAGAVAGDGTRQIVQMTESEQEEFDFASLGVNAVGGFIVGAAGGVVVAWINIPPEMRQSLPKLEDSDDRLFDFIGHGVGRIVPLFTTHDEGLTTVSLHSGWGNYSPVINGNQVPMGPQIFNQYMRRNGVPEGPVCILGCNIDAQMEQAHQALSNLRKANIFYVTPTNPTASLQIRTPMSSDIVNATTSTTEVVRAGSVFTNADGLIYQMRVAIADLKRENADAEVIARATRNFREMIAERIAVNNLNHWQVAQPRPTLAQRLWNRF